MENKTRTGGLLNDTITFNKEVKHPDPKQHLMLSMKKSIIRIVGLLALPFSIWIGVILLIIAEGYGIKEELV